MVRDRSYENMSLNVRKSIQVQADEVKSQQDVHSLLDLMQLS